MQLETVCLKCSRVFKALYIFTKDQKVMEKITQETSSGGVTINDVIMHIGREFSALKRKIKLMSTDGYSGHIAIWRGRLFRNGPLSWQIQF